MKITGVICEYNPFHNGHAKQIARMKEDGGAVCLMSGNYVQRGEPAICDKHVRAEAAIRCGADLVLELPVSYTLRSAEGFADGGVEIFHELKCVDQLSFGSELGDEAALRKTAEILLREDFSLQLKEKLGQGVSFPKARQEALEEMGGEGKLLSEPNNILGVEYCKALLKRKSNIELMVLRREGSYHQSTSSCEPSASVLRGLEEWDGFMPELACALQGPAEKHSLRAGERSVLGKLRSMTDEEFEALPFGSEGLWRKLMDACRRENSLDDILSATKSKRYTYTRLMRMMMCAFLGIEEEVLMAKAPYVRVLAMNEQGGKLLRKFREESSLILLNSGEKAPGSTYAQLEQRASALYGLFANKNIEAASREERVRFCETNL